MDSNARQANTCPPAVQQRTTGHAALTVAVATLSSAPPYSAPLRMCGAPRPTSPHSNAGLTTDSFIAALPVLVRSRALRHLVASCQRGFPRPISLSCTPQRRLHWLLSTLFAATRTESRDRGGSSHSLTVPALECVVCSVVRLCVSRSAVESAVNSLPCPRGGNRRPPSRLSYSPCRAQCTRRMLRPSHPAIPTTCRRPAASACSSSSSNNRYNSRARVAALPTAPTTAATRLIRRSTPCPASLRPRPSHTRLFRPALL